MDKENIKYIHKGILCSHKKEIFPCAKAWMDPEGTVLSEVSQMKKDKYHMI